MKYDALSKKSESDTENWLERLSSNRYDEKRDRDIYTDWFDTYEGAEEFVQDARRA